MPRLPRVAGRWSLVAGRSLGCRAALPNRTREPATSDQRQATTLLALADRSFRRLPLANQLDLRDQADGARTPDGVGDLVHQLLHVARRRLADVDDEVGV